MRGLLGVKTGKAQSEQMFSAWPSEADIALSSLDRAVPSEQPFQSSD
jgi:hypothetical protein